MAITFRLLTGSALSHQQMDTNLGSYYLSSSLSGSTLTFYKSGSDGLVVSSSHDLADSDSQTLSIVTDQLTISNGNTVTLPTGSDTTYTAGDDLNLVGTVFNNTAPDQVVVLNGVGSTVVTGTYPNFTISSSDTNDNTEYTNLSEFTNDVGFITSSEGTIYTAGTDISIINEVITNTKPDVDVTLTGIGSTIVTGTYPNFTISSSDTDTTYTNLSEFTNDVGFITSSEGTIYTAGEGLTLTGTEFSLTDQHFSGNYSDLSNKPTVGLTLVTNNLTLTKLDGTTDVVDLTPYLDEDARAIASGTLDSVTGIVTFTRDDATTFTLDLSDLLDDTNLVTSVNGANGVVDLDTDDVGEGVINLYDKEVALTGQNITINGTYPNFQLTGSNGSVTSVNGQTGVVTVVEDQTVTLTGGGATVVSGTYPNFTVTSTDTDTNTQLSDSDIAAFGYIKTYTDTNTQLSDSDIAAFGYIKTFTETDTLQSVTSRGNTTSTTITAANFITTSDKRLKSDIKPIQEGLETIKKFVSYEYIKDGVQDAGFIAQEVQQAIPYSVQEGDNGYLTMNDRPVLAHMHKAILQLEARLAAIEEKLK